MTCTDKINVLDYVTALYFRSLGLIKLTGIFCIESSMWNLTQKIYDYYTLQFLFEMLYIYFQKQK